MGQIITNGSCPEPDCCPVYSGKGIPVAPPKEDSAVFYDLTDVTAPVVYVWDCQSCRWIPVRDDDTVSELVDNDDCTFTHTAGDDEVTVDYAIGGLKGATVLVNENLTTTIADSCGNEIQLAAPAEPPCAEICINDDGDLVFDNGCGGDPAVIDFCAWMAANRAPRARITTVPA